jgi:replicative DNA helicase
LRDLFAANKIAVPCDFESERKVLGAIIHKPSLLENIYFPIEIFFNQDNEMIATIIFKMKAENLEISMQHIIHYIGKYSELIDSSVSGYFNESAIIQIVKCIDFSFNFSFLVGVLVELYLARLQQALAINILSKGAKAAISKTNYNVSDVHEKIKQHSKYIDDLISTNAGSDIDTKRLAIEAANFVKRIGNVNTGVFEIDAASIGLPSFGLVGVYGTSGSGKTTLGISLASSMVINGKFKGGYFSGEISDASWLEHLYRVSKNVTYSECKEMEMDDLISDLATFIEDDIKTKLFIDEDLNMVNIEMKIRNSVKNNNGKVFFIENCNHVKAYSDVKFGNVVGEKESWVTKKLYDLSKKLDVIIFLFFNLNKEVAKEKRLPRLGDARGVSENDMTDVWGLFNPSHFKIESFDDGESTKNIAELSVIKSRNGNNFNVRLPFDPNTTKLGTIKTKKLLIESSPNDNVF